MRDWGSALRAVKQTLLGPASVELRGRRYTVSAVSRGMKDDRDYPTLEALARGCRMLLDIGANHGATSLVMAESAGPDARVVAVEASEMACRTILENTAHNGFGERISVVNAVVAERSGTTVDFFWDHASGGASLIEGYLGHRHAIHKVTLSVDDLVDGLERPPQLLKIDVEGAEQRVLEGARRSFERHQPIAMVELHGWQDMSLEKNAAAVLDWCRQIDYSMFYLRTRRAVHSASELRGRGRCHVLLVPGVPSETVFPGVLEHVDTSPL